MPSTGEYTTRLKGEFTSMRETVDRFANSMEAGTDLRNTAPKAQNQTPPHAHKPSWSCWRLWEGGPGSTNQLPASTFFVQSPPQILRTPSLAGTPGTGRGLGP